MTQLIAHDIAQRTNLGIELTADPGVLFLDEPTSGLDSFQAEAVVRVLSKLCVFLSLASVVLRARMSSREVGGWGRDPKKCTGRDWGMGSSTI